MPLLYIGLSFCCKSHILIEMISDFRSYAEALASSESSSQQAAANLRNDGSELPRQVLESLFSMPKISECDPPAMSWKNIVKQLESFAHKRVRLEPSSFMAEELNTQGKPFAIYLGFHLLEIGTHNI